MKRYMKDAEGAEKVKLEINVVYEIEFPPDTKVAAATHKGFSVPEGELLPSEKDALINSQAWDDYCSFIESVEDLMTDYYDLTIYYRNESEDYSFYWGALAKNEDGSLIVDFSLKLRVSNHEPRRSRESQHNKKEQQAKLMELTHGKKPQPVTKQITVNRDRFQDYLDAYLKVDEMIGRAVEIMTRNKK